MIGSSTFESTCSLPCPIRALIPTLTLSVLPGLVICVAACGFVGEEVHDEGVHATGCLEAGRVSCRLGEHELPLRLKNPVQRTALRGTAFRTLVKG